MKMRVSVMFCGKLKMLYEALKANSVNNHSTPVDTILKHCRFKRIITNHFVQQQCSSLVFGR